MKILIKTFLTLIIFILGYVAGNIFPWDGFSFSGGGKSIEGSARVEISLLMDNGQPINNVEIDLAENPGPPPRGGIAVTNEKGIAVFNVQPGNYVVYFNSISFPKNLQAPEPQSIQVSEGNINKKTILLKTKNN